MAALSQFSNQAFYSYIWANPDVYERAFAETLDRQRYRFGWRLTIRHLPATLAVMNRANHRALLAATRYRQRLVYRAIEHERQKAA